MTKTLKPVLIGFTLLGQMACSSGHKSNSGEIAKLAQAQERVLIENSLGTRDRPDWLQSTEVATEAGDKISFTGVYLAGGQDRLATCYRLAEADIQVRIAQEMSQKVKSELLQMSEGLSDRIDPAVLDSLLIESRAEITGLRLSDRFYERFMVGGIERLECHARAKISTLDYNRAKQGLSQTLAEKRPEIRKILNARQRRFAEVDESPESNKQQLESETSLSQSSADQ